jgi:hypothetical protein
VGGEPVIEVSPGLATPDAHQLQDNDVMLGREGVDECARVQHRVVAAIKL